MIPTTLMTDWNNGAVATTSVASATDALSNPPNTAVNKPQVFNFVKELQCRHHSLEVPPVLQKNGAGKVVVDIGLDKGKEFFAALESGYSVYGFEANPISCAKLRKTCEAATSYKCVYVNADNITTPLPLIPNGGYLIEGGAGGKKAIMPMSLSGAGSSLVENAPGVKTPEYKNVTILPVSDVVSTNVYFFKLDVQGFEYEVLQGAKGLFENHVVKTLLMEVYPRGLSNAGTDFLEFLTYIWNDLGMFCSSSNIGSGAFKVNHPGSLPEFAEYLKSLSEDKVTEVSWGAFDDFHCFNREKIWE
jgi:hypothetical protein